MMTEVTYPYSCTIAKIIDTSTDFSLYIVTLDISDYLVFVIIRPVKCQVKNGKRKAIIRKMVNEETEAK